MVTRRWLLLDVALRREELIACGARDRRHSTWSGSRSGPGLRCCSFGVAGSFFPRNNVDQEIEHVGFGQSRSNVGALERSPFVLFGVDPRAHRQLGDEDVAALGEQNRSFGRYHLDLWVRLHDFLNASQGELVDFVVMSLGLEVADGLLPISREDVAVVSR